jgi:hypothetical protein
MARLNRKKGADHLRGLRAEAEADMAAARGEDAPKPEEMPKTNAAWFPPSTLPDPANPALHHQLDLGFPYPLYEWRRYAQAEIDKLEWDIGRTVEAQKNPKLTHGEYSRLGKRIDRMDAEIDRLTAKLNPTDADGQPLLVRCRYQDCPEVHPRATSNRRGDRCALCFLAALQGQRREFNRQVPPPVTY